MNDETMKMIDDFHKIPSGAHNLRENGVVVARQSSENISVSTKNGELFIIVANNTKNESVHIPVLISKNGLEESVVNNFIVGNNCNVSIIASCGIHSHGCGSKSAHNGVHVLTIGENSTVTYRETHTGSGDFEKNMHSVMNATVGKNSQLFVETSQLGGIHLAKREFSAVIMEGASLTAHEKILTSKNEKTSSFFNINLCGKNSSLKLISRNVAKNFSCQEFFSSVVGNEKCNGYVSCDGIICNKSKISATPTIICANADAALVHEATIGKIAGDQLTKLMCLGLDEKEAEKVIINGFLK